MTSPEHPDFPINPETGQPTLGPAELQTQPEMETIRRGRITLAKHLLDGRCRFERYARFKGEPDEEEWSGHRGAVKGIRRTTAKLSPADREILKRVFPEVFSESESAGPVQPDLDNPEALEKLAALFDSPTADTMRREIDLTLERFSECHYASLAPVSEDRIEEVAGGHGEMTGDPLD